MADKSTSPFAGLDKALLRSTKQSSPPPPQKDVEQETAKVPKPDTTIPRHHDTAVSTMPPSNQDTTVAHAEDDILDVVRKAVRQIDKEAATHRFTLDEKIAWRILNIPIGGRASERAKMRLPASPSTIS
jgi:hypothetical protein